MTSQFQPEHPLLRECSFYVLTEIKIPDREEPIRASATATSFEVIGDAISRALFDPEHARTEAELFITHNLIQTLNSADCWNVNTLTGTPLDAHVAFDDGEVEAIVRVFALFDMTEPMTGNTYGSSGADALLASVVGNAVEGGNISFIGQASPKSFRNILSAVTRDETSTLLRLRPPGLAEGELPNLSNMTDSGLVRTVSLIYVDNDGDLAADIQRWKLAGASSSELDGGVTFRITANLATIFNLVERTKANFVGLKITKE